MHDVSADGQLKENSPSVANVLESKGKHRRQNSRTVNEVEQQNIGKSGRYAFDQSADVSDDTLGKNLGSNAAGKD